jgi:DNA-binding SARP family transcriptional activator/ABC-type branched-subunit amino acid transport system substrate-binding protein
MRYLILGPLELLDGSAPVELTGRQRALLAILLINRNEVISSERLIEAIWGTAPPPTAAKALQNAVSQLRRRLARAGEGPLRTEHGGYRLAVVAGELDADSFEELVTAGRAALDAGAADVAVERLGEGLALWRGPPLSDLAYAEFAQPELARLEEERLTAVEDLSDAELGCGGGADLVPRLEEAVAAHPLRERLRAQLMLALYHAGRQADALAAYQDARRVLVDELGIEPGPALRDLEGRILAQDPSIDPPAGRRARATRTRRPRRKAAAAAAALLLLTAAGAAALATTRRDGGSAAAQLGNVPGNSLVAIDPRTAAITAIYPAGSTPTSIAAGAGGTWALNADDGTITRVAARTSSPRELAVPGTPLAVAAGPGGAWVLSGGWRGGPPSESSGPPIPRRVFELDPATGAVSRSVALPPGGTETPFALNALALGRSMLWAIAGDRLTRIGAGAAAGAAPAVVPHVTASAVAAGARGAGAWAITERPESFKLLRLSDGGRVAARIPVVATELDGLAVGAGAAWATAPQDGLLWRVTPTRTRSIDVGAGARGVAVAGGSVWVSNAARGTVTRVDPRSGSVTAVLHIGNAPRALASDGRRVWASVAAGGGVPARDAERANAGAVTDPACSAPVAGAGTPQRLIVSDLPLHSRGISYLPDAIEFELRQRGFRAGRFRVGYQSCDDSTTTRAGYDPEKCRADAAIYARTPRVIGVIGAYNSGCTSEQLRITNRAPGGPLATISPTNTGLELTKPLPGGALGHLPDALYPTGRRHFVRLLGADDGQGAALALFARDRGVHRLAIVHDDDDYGRANAFYARREAERLGIGVIGPYAYRLRAGPAAARRLADRVARTRPDAVLDAGVPYSTPIGGEPPGFALVRELRERLGRRLPILGPDSWADGPTVFAGLGQDARNVFVSYPGVPMQRLGPAGRRFLKEFGATQPGGIVTQDALYAAQATDVLLDAIARSDGSRPSVTRELFATRIEHGLIGAVGFDADGDIHPRPFHFFRLTPRPLPAGEAPAIAAVISP